MNCMRCGKEVQEPAVFCDACLADSSRHPVKPDVVIRLPARPVSGGKIPAKKEPPPPEVQIATLRRRNKSLFTALVCALLALALAAVFLFHVHQPPDEPEQDIGKNYSTIDS